MERTLRNTNMKPLSHASYLRLQVLCQSFWDADEKLGLLNNLSLADLKAFIPQLLSQVCDYVDMLDSLLMTLVADVFLRITLFLSFLYSTLAYL